MIITYNNHEKMNNHNSEHPWDNFTKISQYLERRIDLNIKYKIYITWVISTKLKIYIHVSMCSV